MLAYQRLDAMYLILSRADFSKKRSPLPLWRLKKNWGAGESLQVDFDDYPNTYPLKVSESWDLKPWFHWKNTRGASLSPRRPSYFPSQPWLYPPVISPKLQRMDGNLWLNGWDTMGDMLIIWGLIMGKWWLSPATSQSNQLIQGKNQEVLPGILPCLSGPFNSCGIRVRNPWMGGLGDGRVLIDCSTIILINTYIIIYIYMRVCVFSFV